VGRRKLVHIENLPAGRQTAVIGGAIPTGLKRSRPAGRYLRGLTGGRRRDRPGQSHIQKSKTKGRHKEIDFLPKPAQGGRSFVCFGGFMDRSVEVGGWFPGPPNRTGHNDRSNGS
jgi:hypothetical protein